jgi:hypothetical protein
VLRRSLHRRVPTPWKACAVVGICTDTSEGRALKDRVWQCRPRSGRRKRRAAVPSRTLARYERASESRSQSLQAAELERARWAEDRTRSHAPCLALFPIVLTQHRLAARVHRTRRAAYWREIVLPVPQAPASSSRMERSRCSGGVSGSKGCHTHTGAVGLDRRQRKAP